MGKKTRRVTNKCLAAEAVASNEDLLLQILLRVPTRPLVRFKSVSKQWKSLISDQEFGRNHTLMSRQMASSRSPSGLYFYTDDENLYYVSLSANNHRISPLPLSKPREVATPLGCTLKVIQSCNGLLLCRLSGESEAFDDENYMVYNPATTETAIVPNPDHNWVHEVQYFHLVFDPLDSPYFKVVCLKISDPGYYYEVFIYSSERDSWRSCCHFRPPAGIRYSDSGVLWNGGIHWIGAQHLLRFHIDSESMTTLGMPPKPRRYCQNPTRYFGECQGHLHLIQVKNQSTPYFRVFELDKGTYQLFVKYHIQLCRVISAFPEIVQVIPAGDGDGDGDYHWRFRYAFFHLGCSSRRHRKRFCPCVGYSRQSHPL